MVCTGTGSERVRGMDETDNICSGRDNWSGELGAKSALEVVYGEIWDRIAEKSEAYVDTEIVSAFPPLHHFSPDAVWVGSFSRTVPSKKWRLFAASAAITNGNQTATPPQLTRAYLDIRFPKQLRARKQQLEFWSPRRVQPMYTEPGRYREDMAYLDLRSAYWSLVQTVGWDVDYFPGIIARRNGVSDFPFGANRLARNSLVSLGLPSTGYLYKDGRLIAVPHSWKVNIGLWTCIQDILHGIADDMIKRAGAVYVNTDGYIVPAHALDVAYGIADEWGLPLREKHRGRATVYGVGAYSIGEKICSRILRLNPSVQAVFPRDKDKLRKQVRFLAARYLKE